MARAQPTGDVIRLGPNNDLYYFKTAETSGPRLAGLLDLFDTKNLGKEIEQGVDAGESLLSTTRSQTIGIYPASRAKFMQEIARKINVLRTGGNRSSANNQALVELAGNAGTVAKPTVDESGDDAAAATADLQNAIASLSSARVPSCNEAEQLFPGERVRRAVCGLSSSKALAGGRREAYAVPGGLSSAWQDRGPRVRSEEDESDARLPSHLRPEGRGLPNSARDFKSTPTTAHPPVNQMWIGKRMDHISEISDMCIFHSSRSHVPWVRDAALAPTETKGPNDDDTSNGGDRPGSQNMQVGRFSGGRLRPVGLSRGCGLAASGPSATLVNRITDYSGYLSSFFDRRWVSEVADGDPGQPYQTLLVLHPVEQTILNGLQLLDPELFGRNIALGNMPMERARHVLPDLSCVLQLQRTTTSLNDAEEIEQFQQCTDGGARAFVRHAMLGWGAPAPRAAAELVEFLTTAPTQSGLYVRHPRRRGAHRATEDNPVHRLASGG
ncbi:hypothetical protein FGG08_005742 [Glutinoglossum americanum]|uniref:Uncharacterized protein n=1 Tax=Glutinoglossum americanum TaxID=1670608 RepID=A0A9P8HZS5_9PEZI|nr:hypothetical protein FGG08_005742 [Glutinoglossum americanum]